MRNKYIALLLLFLLQLPAIAARGAHLDRKAANNDDWSKKIAASNRKMKVIVNLKVPGIEELTAESNRFCTLEPGQEATGEGELADMVLKDSIAFAADSVLNSLAGTDFRVNHTYSCIPYLALEVSPEALAVLQHHPDSVHIEEDLPLRLIYPVPEGDDDDDNGEQPVFVDTAEIVGAHNAWDMGYTGSGWYVAILDTGIRKNHCYFRGKTIMEACYAKGEDGVGPEGDCPGGQASMIGPGSARHHPNTYQSYDHGTHVAGIAAGNYGSLAGVARDANIIAVQIFSRFSANACGGAPCVMSWHSDCLAGLNLVYAIRRRFSIAAVNISVGGGLYDSACDSDSRKAAIDNLRAVGIATCIATGNNGACGYVTAPSCVSSCVSVGSSHREDQESWFNNWHVTMQDLFAPGSSVYSSTAASRSSFATRSGTSMATPHVAGAWALVKQFKPKASVSEILNALQNTGVGVTSLCDGHTTPIPRIQVDEAIKWLNAIRVSKPGARMSYSPGGRLPIRWTTSGITGNVKIVLRKSDGSEDHLVTPSAPYNGSPYYYTIPGYVTPGAYQVQVSQGGKEGRSGEFFIGTIIVTSPRRGSYSRGALVRVAWECSGIQGRVNILLRRSHGAEEHILETDVPWNNSPRTTNIPGNVTPGIYRIRVSQKKVVGKSRKININ